jgi:HK97 family phage major capsid protein
MNWMTELLQKRANLVNEARGILDKAQGEKRALVGEETQRYDALMSEAGAISEDIERRRKQEAMDSTLDAVAEQATRPQLNGRALGAGQYESRGMRDVLADGPFDTLPEWRKVREADSPEHRKAFSAYIRGGVQTRAVLQADSDVGGGFLLTPLALVDRLIKAIDDALVFRQWATVFAMPNADTLGAPSLDTDAADATWTSELATGSEDTSMEFGRRDLHPHPLAKRIKISRKLLQRLPSAEAMIISRLAYKFALTQEKAFLTGDGVQKPLGVFTASANGIPTSRDVSTDNTATAFTMNGLINAKYALKAPYWRSAKWLFHRDAIKMLAKLREDSGAGAGTGGYMWQPSVQAGQPDMLLGLPVYASENVPNTFTTGLYVGIVGDFSHYWIADSMAMEMQRLEELYAVTNQIGLIGRLETDGAPVLPEAFARVKLG